MEPREDIRVVIVDGERSYRHVMYGLDDVAYFLSGSPLTDLTTDEIDYAEARPVLKYPESFGDIDVYRGIKKSVHSSDSSCVICHPKGN